MEPIDTHYYFISRKKVFVKDRMSKRKKMSFLFISLPWLSNGILWSINKLKQGLWCTIWLSYIYSLGATLCFGVWWIKGGASYIYTLGATLYFGVWWIRGDASFFLGELLQTSFNFFSRFFLSIVYLLFNHFMYLPKLLAHALLVLWMFVKVTFTHISHDF